MNHKWEKSDALFSKNATCKRCGLFKEVRRYRLKRPVFGNRIGKEISYIKYPHLWRAWEMPSCDKVQALNAEREATCEA